VAAPDPQADRRCSSTGRSRSIARPCAPYAPERRVGDLGGSGSD
jgi:hypothetical protein